MKLADLIFVRGSDFLSREIEDITKSEYSHVAVFAGDDKVLEAQAFRRVGYQNLSYYTGKYDVWTLDSLTDEQRSRIVGFCQGKVGDQYDYGLILQELIRYELDINLQWKEHLNRVICSTLVNEAYNAVGETITNVNLPSPQDLIAFERLRKVG